MKDDDVAASDTPLNPDFAAGTGHKPCARHMGLYTHTAADEISAMVNGRMAVLEANGIERRR
jgi:hypothetical protein